jgi:hypothetical protein
MTNDAACSGLVGSITHQVAVHVAHKAAISWVIKIDAYPAANRHAGRAADLQQLQQQQQQQAQQMRWQQDVS